MNTIQTIQGLLMIKCACVFIQLLIVVILERPLTGISGWGQHSSDLSSSSSVTQASVSMVIASECVRAVGNGMAVYQPAHVSDLATCMQKAYHVPWSLSVTALFPSSKYFPLLLLTIFAALPCPQLPFPLNGRLSISGKGTSALASYQCNQGFSLIGSKSRTCKNGVWLGTAPTCQGEGTACTELLMMMSCSIAYEKKESNMKVVIAHKIQPLFLYYLRFHCCRFCTKGCILVMCLMLKASSFLLACEDTHTHT